MSETLYLDTARLGLMSPTAQRLQSAFARLAGDPHGLLYFREFLTRGYQGCPEAWRSKLPDLDAWRGLDGLSRSVVTLTRAPVASEIVFASRSATLMRAAVTRLEQSCRRVLIVDLLWSPYRRILAKACRRSGIQVVVCPLRTASLHGEEPGDVLAGRVFDTFVQTGCDGLALPLIDHRGVTLPVDRITHRLCEIRHRPACVVVDASQALGHVPIDLPSLDCDFLVAGAHKWVGGYHPLGIGVARQPSSQETLKLVDTDPLLRLSQEASGAARDRHGETAAILPLLTATGAMTDLRSTPLKQRLSVRLANRRRLTKLLDDAGWRLMRRGLERHGIVLAKPPRGFRSSAGRIDRSPFVKRGVTVTSYPNGFIRFSLPHTPIGSTEACRLMAALSDASQAADRLPAA